MSARRSERRRRSPRRYLAAVPALLAILLVVPALVTLAADDVLGGGGTIRVRLTLEPDSVRVVASTVRAVGTGPVDLASSEVELASSDAAPAGGAIEVRTQSKGLLLLPEHGPPHVIDRDTVDLAWDGGARIAFDDASGARHEHTQYGRLRARRQGGRLVLVLVTDLERYLSGVVAAEMGPRFPLEALKAQAVAARGFAYSAIARRRGREWDVRDDARDQVFQAPSRIPLIVRAVRETRGECVLWDDKPLRSYYHSTCGGRTRDGRERFRDVPAPPFRSQPCEACQGSPLYRWQREVPTHVLAELGVADTSTGLEIAPLRRSARGDWLEPRWRNGSGGWRELALAPLALPSPWIERIDVTPSGLTVHGRGFGHGVGLCQYGAAARANDGASYREILAWYYNGAKAGVPDADSVPR